jgi:hypothetical protein
MAGARVTFTLTGEERETLERWARRPKSAQALALRCPDRAGRSRCGHSKDIAARWAPPLDGPEMARPVRPPWPRRAPR